MLLCLLQAHCISFSTRSDSCSPFHKLAVPAEIFLVLLYFKRIMARKLLGEAIGRLQRQMSHQNGSLNIRLGETIRSLEFSHAEITELKARKADARQVSESCGP